MTPFEKAQLVVQIIGVIALILTLYIYYRQLRTMGAQLQAAQRASSAQNILALTSFLQAPEVRAARETVRVRLPNKNYGEWSEDERRDAARVCSTYDVAGIIVRLGLVPPETFVDNWGPSIRHCYEVLKPLILEMQKPENSGPGYWDDFGWLYQQSWLIPCLAPANKALHLTAYSVRFAPTSGSR
jgi:hypothetical protein